MNYLVLRGSKDTTLSDEKRFHSSCLEKDWPFVVVRHLPNWSELHWDYITLSCGQENLLSQTKAQEAFRGFRILAEAIVNGSKLDGDIFVGWVRTQQPEQAEKLAKVLCVCFSLCLND